MANQDIGVQHTLKDLRVRLNLSQELAAKGSVSVPTLRSWENDSSNLTLAQMKRLADFYKIPLV
ncbi:helix-turn-helix domain-containing protein [Lactobacillus jensenii]|uniref:helix-turn-helix domain-containing protein n=1 Tax=Lactobacillus jensenii TaxID=109790 RepID=UPI00177EE9A1|nr:helix-turn-helix transcriptional regulator [Lactobacillus jensenii]